MSNIVPYHEIESMAGAIASSGLFGLKTVPQAIALMLVAQANGQSPGAAVRDYDVIQNRPAKKAEAMLRDFIQAGGSVEWHELTNDIADATFKHPQGGTIRIDWTMQRARDAGLGGKEMWKKWPRQMLRSRCISEGVRTIYPAATGGLYAPEEVQDIPPRQPAAVDVSELVIDETPTIPKGRLEVIEVALDSADSLMALQETFLGLTKEERHAAFEAKERNKARLLDAEWSQ